MFAKYRTQIVKNDIVFKRKPEFTSLDEVLKQIDVYVRYLRTLDSYRSKQVGNILMALLYIHEEWSQNVGDISQRLVDNHFSIELKSMTEYFSRLRHTFFKSEGSTDLFHYYLKVSVIWNYTDISASFSKSIIDTGLIEHYAFNVSHQPYLKRRQTKVFGTIVSGSLSILHNTIRHCPEYKQHFRDNNVHQAVEPFLKDEDDETKCDAILVMSAVIHDEEAEKLEDTGSIAYIVEHIGAALMDKDHRCDGFSVVELLLGLSRIAVNDKNKITTVEAGALPLLVSIMKTGDEEEQASAAKTVWMLCFVEHSKQKVKEEADCIETLKTLTKSNSQKVRSSAEGALWELLGAEAHPKQTAPVCGQEKHLFISYNWGHSEIVHRIKDRLKKDGYKIWIDVEQMHGSINDTIANAIESSSVILVCLSEKYKLSASCRSEAKYAKKRNVPFVPLMMQRKYQPDGWLGMLIEDEYYVDFAKYDFAKAYSDLCKHIEPYLSETRPVDVTDGRIVPAVAPVVEALPPTVPASPVIGSGRGRRYEAVRWSSEQVQQWVSSCDLRSVINGKLQALLDSMDGESLVAFCWVKDKVPEYFMNNLSQKYDADMLQLVVLIKALNKLP